MDDLDRAKGEWGLVLNYHFRDEYHVVSMDHFCEPHGHYNVTHGPSRFFSGILDLLLLAVRGMQRD